MYIYPTTNQTAQQNTYEFLIIICTPVIIFNMIMDALIMRVIIDKAIITEFIYRSVFVRKCNLPLVS